MYWPLNLPNLLAGDHAGQLILFTIFLFTLLLFVVAWTEDHLVVDLRTGCIRLDVKVVPF